MKLSTRSRRRWQDGAVATEAGLTLSLLLLLMVGSVEFGRTLWTYNTMLLAVEEAGRYAMIYQHGRLGNCAVQSQVSNCPAPSNTPLANCSSSRAQQVLSAYQTGEIGVSVREDQTAFPATITICANHSIEFVAPRLLRYGPSNLTSRLTVPLI